MATRLVLAVGLITALVPVRAGAESISTASGASEIKETEHSVRVRFGSSFAELTVTRNIKYAGTGTDELVASLDLPAKAAAVGFKSRFGKRAWRQGSFLSASQADKTYAFLTRGAKRRANATQDGVVKLSADGESLALDAYPLTEGLEIAVEYRVTVPLCYSKGVHYFYYPKDVSVMVTPSPGRIAWVAKKGLDAHGPNHCARSSLGAGVMVASQQTVVKGPVRAELGVLHLQSSGRTVVRLRAESANQLAAAPREAKTVFVVDASHSVSDEALARQVELMRAYADKMPRGRFELVLTQRRAKRLFGTFVSASDLRVRLAKPLPRSNGSFLEHSVVLATAALKGHSGPQRVVAFTDGLRGLRHTVAPVLTSGQGLSNDAVLHLVALNKSSAWQRNDKLELFELAKATGGIALALGAKTNARRTRALAAHLITPQHVHGLEVEYGAADSISEEQFRAGRSLEHFVAVEELVRSATVTGQLWSTPFAQKITPSPIVAAALPALSIGADFATDPELKELALLARAVTKFTSYLAKPKGMDRIYREPEKGGGTGGGVGFGTSGCGGCCIGRRSSVSYAPPLPKKVRVDALRELITPMLKSCSAAARGGVSLRIDTTLDEIVDVSVLGANNEELAGCALEASWDARLPAGLFPEARASYAVPLSR